MRALRNTSVRRSAALAGMTIALLSAAALSVGQADEREQIGEVLGKPVYRDEIRKGKNANLGSELRRLFAGPVMEQYRRAHRAEIEPTEEEIATAAAYFDAKHRERIKGKETDLRDRLKAVEEKLAGPGLTKEERKKLESERSILQARLKPPGRSFALFVLKNGKFQRYLYRRYGGGRILWQQAGIEAFDAMHNLLKEQEKNGKFRIADPQLRSVFYEYWTTMKHGAFLTGDKERIRTTFLEPPWLIEKPSKK